MRTAAVLLVYAVAVVTVGWPLLTSLTGRTAYPLLGAIAWLAACLSVLASAVLATVVAAGVHPVPDALVDGCLLLARHTSGHAHLVLPAVALPAAAALGLRTGWTTATGYLAELRVRRRHLQALRLLGRADRRLGVTVVESTQPTVYCLAGRRPAIVVTTTALRALTRRQLAAVLAHERCHLDEKHHLLMRAGQLLARAFPFVPMFVETGTRVRTLLEMRADDVAARRHGPRVVAAALAAVADAGAPDAALTGGFPSPAARAVRLLEPHRQRRWPLLTTVAVLVAGPAVGLLVPFCGA